MADVFLYEHLFILQEYYYICCNHFIKTGQGPVLDQTGLLN